MVEASKSVEPQHPMSAAVSTPIEHTQQPTIAPVSTATDHILCVEPLQPTIAAVSAPTQCENCIYWVRINIIYDYECTI